MSLKKETDETTDICQVLCRVGRDQQGSCSADQGSLALDGESQDFLEE